MWLGRQKVQEAWTAASAFRSVIERLRIVVGWIWQRVCGASVYYNLGLMMLGDLDLPRRHNTSADRAHQLQRMDVHGLLRLSSI